jgi:hypothetical protein
MWVGRCVCRGMARFELLAVPASGASVTVLRPGAIWTHQSSAGCETEKIATGIECGRQSAPGNVFDDMHVDCRHRTGRASSKEPKNTSFHRAVWLQPDVSSGQRQSSSRITIPANAQLRRRVVMKVAATQVPPHQLRIQRRRDGFVSNSWRAISQLRFRRGRTNRGRRRFSRTPRSD